MKDHSDFVENLILLLQALVLLAKVLWKLARMDTNRGGIEQGKQERRAGHDDDRGA